MELVPSWAPLDARRLRCIPQTGRGGVGAGAVTRKILAGGCLKKKQSPSDPWVEKSPGRLRGMGQQAPAAQGCMSKTLGFPQLL